MNRLWRHNNRRPEAAGMVLIELAAVISVTAMLLAIVVTVFAGIYRIDRSWGDAVAGQHELGRLAARFREDAHRAQEIQIAEGGGVWSFVFADDRRADYELIEGGLRRTELGMRDGEAVPGKQQELSVPAGAKVEVHRLPIARDRLVQLTVSESGSRGELLRVDAHLGRFALRNSGDEENEESR